jgi:thiol-disulfide isomerase/thioredoxin
MDTRRALLLAIALGGATLVWIATRHARAVQPGSRGDGRTDGRTGEAVTLRFYRNPKAAPQFVARELDGHELSTASLRGKVVIINFWATWCGPCRAEIPDLVALQEKYRDRLQVIGISQDESAPEVVQRFAAKFHINYPVVMMTPELEKLFPGIGALPTSFVWSRKR